MNKKVFSRLFYGFAAFLFFIPMNVFCAQSEIDRHISKLEDRYESMKDFRADFEQETSQSSIKIVQKAKGEVYFKKGGRMLWHYNEPEKQQIILDGKNLWIYLPDEKQVMKNNFNIIPTHIVVDLFRGKINIQHKFKVIYVQNIVKSGKSEIVLELVPLIYDPTLTKLILHINPEKYFITSSAIEDEFGNVTVLKFINISVDSGIKDSLFIFKPPPGVDVFEPPLGSGNQ